MAPRHLRFPFGPADVSSDGDIYVHTKLQNIVLIIYSTNPGPCQGYSLLNRCWLKTPIATSCFVEGMIDALIISLNQQSTVQNRSKRVRRGARRTVKRMAIKTTYIRLGLQYVFHQCSSDRVLYNTDSPSAHQIELPTLDASKEFGTVEPNISSLFSSWLKGIQPQCISPTFWLLSPFWALLPTFKQRLYLPISW